MSLVWEPPGTPWHRRPVPDAVIGALLVVVLAVALVFVSVGVFGA